VLNTAYYLCPHCVSPTPQYIFGPPSRFNAVANTLGARVLGELPLVPGVSENGDQGVPYVLARRSGASGESREKGFGEGGKRWVESIQRVASQVWEGFHM
jgi:ATP-binding protein involved in chromosome partitioning